MRQALRSNTSVIHDICVGRYALIETDPRFTNYRNWLSSDYMLSALALDPALTQKRLGDGFYEQRLINEQVMQLTGQRFLGDYSSNDAQYRGLMDAGVTYAKQWNLRPGIALTPAQVAQLTSDIVWLVEQSVTLPDGTSQRVLVPQVYVRVQPGDLDGSGALIAGRNVDIHLSGALTNSGTAAGRNVMSLTAENINNLGGRMQGNEVAANARNDLNNLGGVIQGKDSLTATAGRDLNVETTTLKGSGSAGAGVYSSTQLGRVAGLYVTGDKGLLIASAGRDVNLIAAQISNGANGTTAIAAGRDLNLKIVTTQDATNITWDSQNYARFGRSEEVGAQINGGTIALAAGNDVNARAANVQAAQGLNVQAGNNINIEAGRKTDYSDMGMHFESSGFLSSSSTTTREASAHDNAVASTLGGNTVALQSGKDIRVSGSHVVGDTGVQLKAGRDVSIEAATNTQSASSFYEHKESGLLSGGGIGITVGKRAQSMEADGQQLTHAKSTVGATQGNVSIQAGNAYKQSGSDVLAPGGNISINAKNVAITAVQDSAQSEMTQKFSQSGISVGVSSPLINLGQGVQQMSQAASQTQNARMQALAAASAGLNIYNNGKAALDSVNALASGNPANAASLSVSAGSSRSESRSESKSQTAVGSTVQAGGSVSIQAAATPATPSSARTDNDGNLLIQGSTVKAGGTVNLQADKRVDLLAASSDSSATRSNSGSSASVGLSIGAGGMGATVSGSRNSGKGDGADTVYTNTRIEAGKSANLQSGADTTLRGAVVKAEQVTAKVGGNLDIESQQDRSTYRESSQSAGGSVTFGPAPGASLSLGKTHINSNYQSVAEQSGIKAGDGGFKVEVKGNTDLTGGAITSTDKAVADKRNSFSTGGTLTTSDIQNSAGYSGSGYSVGIGISLGQVKDSKTGETGTRIRPVDSSNGNAGSTTVAAISGIADIAGIAGNKTVRTGHQETGISKIVLPPEFHLP